MIKSFQQFNESLRDKMTGRPEDDIRKMMSGLSPSEKISKGIANDVEWAVIEGIEEIVERGDKVFIPPHEFMKLVSNKSRKVIQMLVDGGYDVSKIGVAPTLVKTGDVEFAKYVLGLGVPTDMSIHYIRGVMNSNRPGMMEVLRLIIGKNKMVQGKIKRVITNRTNRIKQEEETISKYKSLLP